MAREIWRSKKPSNRKNGKGENRKSRIPTLSRWNAREKAGQKINYAAAVVAQGSSTTLVQWSSLLQKISYMSAARSIATR